MPPSTAIPPKPFHLRPSTRSIPFIPSTSSHPVLYPDKHVNHKRKMSQRGYAVSKECPAAMNRHKNLARKARQDQNAHPEHAPNTRDEPPGTHAKSHTPAPPRKNTSAISHNWRIVAVAGERRRELRAGVEGGCVATNHEAHIPATCPPSSMSSYKTGAQTAFPRTPPRLHPGSTFQSEARKASHILSSTASNLPKEAILSTVRLLHRTELSAYPCPALLLQPLGCHC